MKNISLLLSTILLAIFFFFFQQITGQQHNAFTGLPIGTSSLLCGMIFNLLMVLIYFSFGERIFKHQQSRRWLYLQLLINACLLTEQIWVFCTLMCLALILHINICIRDVHQTIRQSDYFLVFSGFSVLLVILLILFTLDLTLLQNFTTIRELRLNPASLAPSSIFLGTATLALMVGIFPFHFWVRPVFLAPTRYGLAAIMRINLGFVFWCKFGFLANQVFLAYPRVVIFLLTANLLYSAIILFGEKKLSGIAASLYQWHVPLFILSGLLVNQNLKVHSLMDFLNTAISISSLMILVAMLRDRIGTDRLDSSTGLAISFPIFGLAFLFCVLSLIGFPGTVGFVSSEILLHTLSEFYWPVAGCFVIALALNGYSCFRIFGDSFYGDPSQAYPQSFQPKFREKVTLFALLLVIVINGLGPDLLAKIFK